MTGQERRAATMRDVAERAGVSRSLVSTVFRGVPGASAATRERVLQAAADLGYRPDDRARHLRSRDPRVIGVTLTATQLFHVSVVEALHDAVALRGYELTIALSTQTRTLQRAVDTLLAQRCAAVLLIGPTASADEIGALADAAAGLPVIAVDRHLDLPGVDAVRIDDAAALRECVGHLVGLGHRDIWHVSGGDYVSAAPRQEGYLAAMAHYGLADHAHVVAAGGSAREGAAAALHLLEGSRLPTAICAYNDRAACGIIDVFWRKGIRVPDDVSIIGFDNLPEAAMPHMDFTTIEQRADDLAAATLDVLVHRLEGAPPGGLRLMPPGPLVVRSSTTRPRSGGLRSVAG